MHMCIYTLYIYRVSQKMLTRFNSWQLNYVFFYQIKTIGIDDGS